MNKWNILIIEDFIKSKTDVTNQTKINYLNTYKRLIVLLFGDDLKKSIIRVLKRDEPNHIK